MSTASALALTNGAALIVLIFFVRLLVNETVAADRKTRAHASHERELHNEQLVRLVTDFAAERREWAAERTVLLNRIQDPAATAWTSNVSLTAPAPDVGMEVEH